MLLFIIAIIGFTAFVLFWNHDYIGEIIFSVIVGPIVGFCIGVIIYGACIPTIFPLIDYEEKLDETIYLTPIVEEKYIIVTDGRVNFIDENNPKRNIDDHALSLCTFSTTNGKPYIEEYVYIPSNLILRIIFSVSGVRYDCYIPPNELN